MIYDNFVLLKVVDPNLGVRTPNRLQNKSEGSQEHFQGKKSMGGKKTIVLMLFSFMKPKHQKKQQQPINIRKR